LCAGSSVEIALEDSGRKGGGSGGGRGLGTVEARHTGDGGECLAGRVVANNHIGDGIGRGGAGKGGGEADLSEGGDAEQRPSQSRHVVEKGNFDLREANR
jgi:hypothetical protein